jgi:hypothetical protein
MTQHHSESGQNRNKRKEHDRKARRYEARTDNPYRLSKTGRTLVTVVIVILVVALTWFLAFGVFHL